MEHFFSNENIDFASLLISKDDTNIFCDRYLKSCTIVTETAEVNIQPDSHVGGDIYRPMHPLRTFISFHKLREKFSNGKMRQLKLGIYLAKLIQVNTFAFARFLPVVLVITSAVSDCSYLIGQSYVDGCLVH